MKQYLPYNVLLALAILVSAGMAFYNLVLRESFPVLIGYTLPLPEAPAVSEPAPASSRSASGQSGAAAQEDWYDEDQEPYEQESQGITSVQFPLELNAASREELMFIPGVGDVMSQRIVQYRDVLGGYESLAQLKEIKGVGDQTYGKIAAYLYLAEEPSASQNESAGDAGEETDSGDGDDFEE